MHVINPIITCTTGHNPPGRVKCRRVSPRGNTQGGEGIGKSARAPYVCLSQQSTAGQAVERAKARGVKIGRKPKLTPHQRQEILRRKENGEAVREIARSYNVHNSTISRL
jgi:DNA-binding NarL/FixJ family response regulator